MKKFTLLKTLMLFCLFATTEVGNAQPCISSFVYTINPGNIVTFSATSTFSTGTTVYNWVIYGINATSFTTTSFGGLNPSYTFSTNGTFSVALYVVNNLLSCNAVSGQTLAISNNSNTPCTLGANFTISQGLSGAVTLNNTSTGTVPGTTYYWNFGDNSTGAAVSPVHTYSADGVYSATLTANNNFTNNCTSTIVKTVKICSYTPMTSSYTYSANLGNVTFTSTSTGTNSATIYNWIFYAAVTPTISSGVGLNQASASYSLNGSYYTILQIINPVTTCSSSSSQTIVVTNTNTPCTINADFSVTQGINGSTTLNNLTSGTVGGTTYFWNFGDNSTGTSISPVHTYSADGIYTATLTANNNFTNTSCISTKIKNVVVCSYTPLNPSFLYTINGLNVTFTSTSTGTTLSTNYNWYSYYGVGTFSNGVNVTQASITYTAYGVNIVQLLINNPVTTCNASSTQTIVLTNTCTANAGFSLSPTGTPQVWNAIPASAGSVTSAVWSWGDGSTSNTLFTSHTYSAAGTYSICLSVTVACGATNTYCNAYYVFRGSGANQGQDMIQVNVIDPSTVGIKNYGNNTAEFSISPNPNNGVFNLKMSGLNGIVNIVVYDLTGKIIYEQNVQSNTGDVTKEINLNEVPAGLYFLKANSDGKVFSKKIVIEK